MVVHKITSVKLHVHNVKPSLSNCIRSIYLEVLDVENTRVSRVGPISYYVSLYFVPLH